MFTTRKDVIMAQVRIDEITDLPLFEGISAEDCAVLTECLGCRARFYKKDAHIFLDGEMKGNAGIVIDGVIHMYKEDIWGNRFLLSYMKRGEILGESFALSKDGSAVQNSITFVCDTPSRVLFLPVSRILHPCTQSCLFHHQLAHNTFSMISTKNRDLMRKIEVISRTGLRDKILTFLSLEAQRQGSSIFRLPLNRTEMAEYLSVNRSAMSRELSLLKKEGIIDYDRDRFFLHTSPKEE